MTWRKKKWWFPMKKMPSNTIQLDQCLQKSDWTFNRQALIDKATTKLNLMFCNASPMWWPSFFLVGCLPTMCVYIYYTVYIYVYLYILHTRYVCIYIYTGDRIFAQVQTGEPRPVQLPRGSDFEALVAPPAPLPLGAYYKIIGCQILLS